MALQTSFIIANTKGECVKNMLAILLNIMKINENWGCQTPNWQKIIILNHVISINLLIQSTKLIFYNYRRHWIEIQTSSHKCRNIYNTFISFFEAHCKCCRQDILPNISLCVPQKKLYRFGMTWGWVNKDFQAHLSKVFKQPHTLYSCNQFPWTISSVETGLMISTWLTECVTFYT